MKKSLARTADTLETLLGATAFVSMFLAIVLQVFYRYILGSPLVWPFEFSVYCYIYVIYIGSVMAARRQSHVSFDMLYLRLPGRLRLALGIFTNVFVALMFLATLPSSIGYIRMVGAVPSSSLDVPWGAVLAVYPVGMVLVSLILLSRAYSDLMDMTGPGGHQ